MGRRRGTSGPVGSVYAWVRGQSVKAKTALGAFAAILAFAALWALVRDHNHFFVTSEAVHAAGIIFLIYKLTSQKTCFGLSLKFQELTAIFLAVRFYCSVIIEKLVPSIVLAIFVHPFLYKHHSRFLWAFAMYLESLFVLPQL